MERRNETGWRNGMQECENGVRKVRRVQRGGGRSPSNTRHAERTPTRPPQQAGEGKNGAGEGGRQARSYDRTGNRLCVHDMQNMTSHDTPQEVPPARMTKHDIS